MAAEAKATGNDEVEEENACAQMVNDPWSDWKRMLINCEWSFGDNKSAPAKYIDVDEELKKILDVMKDKKIKASRVRKKKDLVEALTDIGCYASYKEYINKHLSQ